MISELTTVGTSLEEIFFELTGEETSPVSRLSTPSC